MLPLRSLLVGTPTTFTFPGACIAIPPATAMLSPSPPTILTPPPAAGRFILTPGTKFKAVLPGKVTRLLPGATRPEVFDPATELMPMRALSEASALLVNVRLLGSEFGPDNPMATARLPMDMAAPGIWMCWA